MSKRVEWVAFSACAILAAGLMLTACTSPSSLLTMFFDGVPPPGEATRLRPVVKPPRRLPYKPPEQLVKIVEIIDLPPPIDWRGRYRALAKNDAGDVDWARALAEKTITINASLAAGSKDDESTDEELEYVPKGQPKYKVVFAHTPHTLWLRCTNCHDHIFEMEQGKAPMTMDNINAGAYCGVCHAKVASPDLDSCPACHKAM